MDFDDYDELYSYGFYVDYYLPTNEAPTVDMARLAYEDLGEVYVYFDGDDSIPVHHKDMDTVLFRRRGCNRIYMECLKLYEECESEDEINFEEDAKKIYHEGIAELLKDFQGQLQMCERSLKKCQSEEDRTFIQDNIKYTKGIINNLCKLSNMDPKVTIQGEEIV